jgi:serine protease
MTIKNKIKFIAFSALILLGLSSGGQIKADSFIFGSHLNNVDYRSKEIIVKFRPDVSDGEIEAVNNANQTEISKKSRDGFLKLKISEKQTVEDLLKKYKDDPRIEYAEPNYIAKAQMIPNDAYYSYQWNFKNMNLENAWEISQGAGATVAIVDTGVAYENYKDYQQAPDLAGTLFVAGYDFVENDTHPNDDNGHGTHLAGTIAQTTNNNTGTAGIAPKALIMPIKALDKNGEGTYFDIAQAIYWAADHGADIINLSLGGKYPSIYMEEACAYAYSKGVTIFAAAGNDSSTWFQRDINWPAQYDEYVIAVGSIRFDEKRASYSNTGSSLDLMAPGGDLSVDQNRDGYGDGILQQSFRRNRPTSFAYYFYQGTSMACAHASGTAALLVRHGISTPQEIRQLLQTTAEDKGEAGWDEDYGWGIIDVYQALIYNQNSETTTPPPAEEPPAEEQNQEETEEQNQTAEKLEIEGSAADRHKNPTNNFQDRDRIYGLVKVLFDGQPVNNADVQFKIRNGQGEIVEQENDDTNREGESFEYLGRLGKGIYTLLIEVNKEGYEPANLEINFEVE